MRTTRKKVIQTESRRKGVALLMTVVISSVMLSVGLGVYERTYKQIVFASFWKQMQIAFASANGGLECAFYWDTHTPADSKYTCFGNTEAVWPSISAGTSQTLIMTAYGVCTEVTITKNTTAPLTTIQSRGYNDACGSTNPRRVERGLRIDY